jgi:hypothetical protein
VESVVDIGTQGVQRHAPIRVTLPASHLSATQATGHLHLDALGAGAHRAGERSLHRPPECYAILQLLSDRLRHQAGVELGALDLEDVDLYLLAGNLMQVTPQLVDLGSGLTDHDARTGRVNVDLDFARVLADRDVRQARV